MFKCFIMVFLIYMLAACSPAISPAGTTVPTSLPPVSPEPSAGQASNPYRPRVGDSELQRSAAYVNSAQVSALESEPPRVELLLAGSLPTPCHELRVDVHAPYEQGRIDADVYSLVDPDKICTQVLADFKASIPLNGYPAGQYNVWVGDVLAGSFTVK